ncbi:hypothetical protein ACLKA7_007819 [Drosophila subpalustris]
MTTKRIVMTKKKQMMTRMKTQMTIAQKTTVKVTTYKKKCRDVRVSETTIVMYTAYTQLKFHKEVVKKIEHKAQCNDAITTSSKRHGLL